MLHAICDNIIACTSTTVQEVLHACWDTGVACTSFPVFCERRRCCMHCVTRTGSCPRDPTWPRLMAGAPLLSWSPSCRNAGTRFAPHVHAALSLFLQCRLCTKRLQVPCDSSHEQLCIHAVSGCSAGLADTGAVTVVRHDRHNLCCSLCIDQR